MSWELCYPTISYHHTPTFSQRGAKTFRHRKPTEHNRAPSSAWGKQHAEQAIRRGILDQLKGGECQSQVERANRRDCPSEQDAWCELGHHGPALDQWSTLGGRGAVPCTAQGEGEKCDGENDRCMHTAVHQRVASVHSGPIRMHHVVREHDPCFSLHELCEAPRAERTECEVRQQHAEHNTRPPHPAEAVEESTQTRTSSPILRSRRRGWLSP
mmetsp:Transcript_21768/g.70088  ORF Transcript_21768/g.70088 Transcript_21768/m.70088 type:complete len:213 (-) Transcript_21768:10-648(-)